MTSDANRRARHRWAFAAILGFFLCLAVLFNVATPVYESPDELQHAAFVMWLADGRGLPTVNSKAPGPWEQEGTQPPLYYWLISTLVGKTSHDPVNSLAKLNPYAAIGDPERPDNKNRVLHDPAQESWPYRDDVLFVHLARGISTLLAVGTLAAIYRLGRTVFPKRPGIALGMVGLVAFTPQFLFLSASINNDNLVILIAAWTLVLLAYWLRVAKIPNWASLAGLGILLGLATLAKFSGLLLWPLAGGVLLWLAWQGATNGDTLQQQLRWLVPAGLLVFGLALALSGWWFVRNLMLYGDLSGIRTHLEIMGARRRPPTTPDAIREFNGFRYSFWALFGWFNILVPEPFYWLMDGLTLLGGIGFCIFVLRSLGRRPSWTRHVIVMLSVWLGLVAVGILQWTGLTLASQGRLLYPALPAIALFLVVGWAELLPQQVRLPVGVIALAGWVVWAALCPFLFIEPAYAQPQRVQSLDELAFVPSGLQVRYADCCELVGYVQPEGPVRPGDRVPLTLVWKASEPMDHKYTMFVHALTAEGQLVGQLDTYHGGGLYPTSQWRPGEFIVDTAYVPISWKAEGPALVHFNVGLHRTPYSDRVGAFAPDGQELIAVFAGEAALLPSEWPVPRPLPQIDTVFGQQIRLVGAELSQTTVRPGSVVTATLQWAALTRITEDYVGFIHVTDSEGQDVTQDDHQPLQGRFPTRLWPAGAVISDPYRLELPGNLEAGTYELWGGFYRPGSGERLEAIWREAAERWKDDLVHIGTLAVTSD